MAKRPTDPAKAPHFASFEGLLDPQAGKFLPEPTARELLVAPIRRLPQGLVLAMLDKLDLVKIDSVAALTGLRVLPVLTDRANLIETIRTLYAPAQAAPPPGPPPAPASKNGAELSVIDAMQALFSEAVECGASDIHLEPSEKAVVVRFRLDGVLQDRKTFPTDALPALVARVKILSRLDITETRLPQDGHIRLLHHGRGVDLRISTLPSLFGEKVVIRLLDHSKGIRRLTELGMPAALSASFERVLERPTGLLLVTGPTGSGKTTTLYAALSRINTRDKNIVTLEDPIEYYLPGITQSEAAPRIGFTFAAGLRAILRQDPNVLLVGEIRDDETAEIAVQAAMTGHLVLSTLHTKDAVGTVARLLNMKVQPFLLASALSGVLAQRLVRVLCPACKRKVEPPPEAWAALGEQPRPGRACFAPVGCAACRNTGYSGRVALYEWLELDDDFRALVFKGASDDELRRAARAKGARSLREDGLEKVERGVTSLAEVLRVVHEGAA